MDNCYWLLSIYCYTAFAILTLLPSLDALFWKVPLNPGGISFDKTSAFSTEARTRLSEHYSRLEGTLGFWKKRATFFTRFHYYCFIWTIFSAWAVPLLSAIAPQTNAPASKWLLVVVSSHVALALSFHRGLKISENMKAFRHGESDFYDLYRRLMDRPTAFGVSESEQLDKYFSEVENIRKFVRSAETESIPDIEAVKQISTAEK
tara:strand:- start:1297 stop:1911 length:615 start_codon:yes stop_codon:yes gene_type:complete